MLPVKCCFWLPDVRLADLEPQFNIFFGGGAAICMTAAEKVRPTATLTVAGRAPNEFVHICVPVFPVQTCIRLR